MVSMGKIWLKWLEKKMDKMITFFVGMGFISILFVIGRMRLTDVAPPGIITKFLLLNPCKKVLLRNKIKPSSPKAKAFALKWVGRFGNKIIAIMNALVACRVFGINQLYIPDSGEFFNGNFRTSHGVNITLYRGRPFHFVQPIEFWIWYEIDQCPSNWFLEAANDIKPEILRHIPDPGINHTTLVMHFRGGDNMIRSRSRYYGQPVCSFYTEAMDLDQGHDKVLIVWEDMLNPCVRVCMEKGAVRGRRSSYIHDFSILLWSKRLVLSRSTFSRAAMYLSPHKRIWYVFGGLDPTDPGRGTGWHVWRPLGEHWHCEPSKEFQIEVMENWGKSNIPRLLTDRCNWFRAFGQNQKRWNFSELQLTL
jgi:hypothetical protein